MSDKEADLRLLALRAGGDAAPDAKVPLPPWPWRTRLLLPGVILAATAATVVFAAGDVLWPAATVHVVPAVAKAGVAGAAEAAVGQVVVQAPGWVEADPYAISVSALTDGVVCDVPVLEGQSVAAGQVVARLIDDDARLALARAEAALKEQQAALETARAVAAAAQRDWDNPTELLRKREVAAAQRAQAEAELARWPDELAAEEARLTLMQAEFDRIGKLYRDSNESQIEYIRARQQFEMQQAVVQSTRAREPVLQAQLHEREAELHAAEEHLRLRIGDTRTLATAQAAEHEAEAAVALAVAARDEAALRLDRTQVRSPVTGMVMVRLVEPGSKVMLNADNPRSAQVVRLYDPARLQVRVDVPLADAAHVGVGQPAEVVVDVLPDRVFRGHVTRIVHEADLQKNTLQVKVAILDPVAEIKPEMLARARFLAQTSTSQPAGGVPTTTERLYVPARLVGSHGGGGAHVWLADQGRNVAVRQMVTVGRGRIGDWVEIASGLHAGDRLIADPPASLRDGQRLRVVGEIAPDGEQQPQEGGQHGSH